MKTSFISILPLAVLALSSALRAQTVSPSREVTSTPTTSADTAAVIPDGTTFYKGHTYLIRNGRAAMVNAALVPDGKILTPEGRLAEAPSDFIRSTTNTPAAVPDGLLFQLGRTYWIHKGLAKVIDASVIPEGKVLNREGELVPLPADFSGFPFDPASTGTQPASNSQPVGVSK